MQAVQGGTDAPKLEAVPLALRPGSEEQRARKRRSAEQAVPGAEAASSVPLAVPRFHSPFVPMLLVLLSLLVWFGFQGLQLWKERSSYIAAVQRQGPRMERAQQFRSEFDSLTADTAHLAAVGNASAKQLVDALKQRGLAIDAEKSAPISAGAQGSR